MILKLSKNIILSVLCILLISVWFASFFQIKNTIPSTITVDNILNTVSAAGSHLDSMVEDLASGGNRAQTEKTKTGSENDSVVFFLITLNRRNLPENKLAPGRFSPLLIAFAFEVRHLFAHTSQLHSQASGGYLAS